MLQMINNEFNAEESAQQLKIKLNARNKITLEIVEELYKAKKHYSNSGYRSDLVRVRTRLETFKDYMEYIGIKKQTAYDWLERYEPNEQKLLSSNEVKQKKQSKEEYERGLIAEYRRTGKKPIGWNDEIDAKFERSKQRELDAVLRANKEFEQRQERASERAKEHKVDEIESELLEDHANIFLQNHKKVNDWKDKIRISDSGKDDSFQNAIIEYLETLEDDNRKIEACQNIIKICRNISTSLQKIDMHAAEGERANEIL